MLIDKSHRVWMLFTLLAVAISTALYVIYAKAAADGPRGGSWQGIAFGVAGSLLMIFAGLLPGRKKLPRWRVGTARFWLKAHIWLGLLSVPLILFHAGFAWGGLLEQVLLAVFALVILSGIAGVVFQQYLPRQIKETTQREAMFEQVPHVCQALREAADQCVVALCQSLFPPATEEAPGDGGATVAADYEMLRQFYVATVRPFLAFKPPLDSPLMNASRAAALFAQVRPSVPAEGREVLQQLTSICDERRELATQLRLHRWLHLWLYLHVPLSMSLLVLGVVHAIMSVYY